MNNKEENKTVFVNKQYHHHQHHTHTQNVRRKKLLWVTLLNFSISLVQVAGGIISNSLSLISDAIHNLGDTSAIFIAFLAGKHAAKKPDAQKTFGYKRAEILAALFNGVVLIAICIFLLWKPTNASCTHNLSRAESC